MNPERYTALRNFLRSGALGGFILIFCVMVSLLIANSSTGEGFKNLLISNLGPYNILTWINDGLMAIFFLLIGLEIKREIREGELSSFKQASLPVFAATGGAVLPAIIFTIINKGTEAQAGWGIPMATDIAFALGVLSILGKRVPASLKIFLAALAIVDDLIAIIVIAVFYSSDIHILYLYYALALLALLFIFNRFKIRSLWMYLIPGIFIWYFVHHSGIHATIAGVLVALTIPSAKQNNNSPLETLEHFLTKPVNFIIMPIFALANTNIDFSEASVNMLSGGLSAGIILGLLFGKPIGIFLFSWLSVKAGWSRLPHQSGWKHIVGIGVLGGIGFTMSVFIALLSFDDPAIQSVSKLAILAASVVAGIAGYLLLYFIGNKTKVSSR